MDRNVNINIQRWEPISGGRVKVKIAEKKYNITGVTHNGEPYVTIKKYGRGRYMMRLAPGYVRPVPAVSETFTPEQIDMPTRQGISSDRGPMEYQEEP